MGRPGRIFAIFFVALMTLSLGLATARADCSNPMDPDFGQCSPPPGGGETPKPKPSASPTAKPATPAPTPAATRAPVAPVAPVVQQPVSTPLPSETAFPVEVDTSPSADSTKVIVDPLEPDQATLNAETTAASASSWIFGFIVGLIVGGLIGRASWGLRRRRRQQIFG